MKNFAIALALAFTILVPPAFGRPAEAAAPLPADRLHFGVANGPGSIDWMKESGVPWRYRYQYLAGGVDNPSNWTTWQDPTLPPGQFVVDYLAGSGAAGYTPVVTYYEIAGSGGTGGGESESDHDFRNLNSAALMNLYFDNFMLLMQLAGAYGGQAVVHVEPDLWGFLQQRAAGGPAGALGAAVAASGHPDAAGLPDTVEGFAAALLRIRDRYAPNVVMAIHASLWAGSRDIATDPDPALDVQAEGAATAGFLNSAGVASNPYGSTWDVVFNDVDDHDAGWWEAIRGSTAHWWDPSNRRFPNFARYLSWVAELKARTGRPQMAWQVPIGNQHFLTMNNTCHHYQDNVAEYFVSHPAQLQAAGLVGVLFGSGNGCQTSNEDEAGTGVTNNGGRPTTDLAGGCDACNIHRSVHPDNDGGYLRIFVGRYYAGAAPQLAGTGPQGLAPAEEAVVEPAAGLHALSP